MGRLKELGAPVVLVTCPVEVGKRRLNQGFVWSKDAARGVHFKNYLPNDRGYYEASWYERGDLSFSPFNTAKWKGGYMICSDLWSMRNASKYGKTGVHFIAVPRASEKSSVDKWVAAGKVAAVLSEAYVFSSNRTGKRGTAEFGGCGWVIDPDGRLLAVTSRGEQYATVEVDLRIAEEAKSTYPRDILQPE